jgi:hypothetical protein
MKNARDAAFIVRFMRGQTLAEIGTSYGVTRERVRQILSRHGITRNQGGASLKKTKKQELKNQLKNQKTKMNKGCSWDQYKGLRSDRITRFFNQQKNNSKRRGIKWKLTLWQWWSIWEESEHWDERGRGKLKYCMCRKGDVGAYEVGNVFIETNLFNLQSR